MSEFDWRSPEPYQRAIEVGDRTNFAWESLRRSPNYRIACREVREQSGNVYAEFRRRWGVCFRS
ncbi:transcriptional regulator domain-containing protein [Bradyrhizobium sp. USDA 4518]